MNGGNPRTYTSDNLSAVPDWVYRVDAPPYVDDEPQPLTRDRSRDIALLAIAGMVIIAIAAYLLGRASA